MYPNETKKMNYTILAHLLLNIFGHNKCFKSILYIDCNQNNAEILKIGSEINFSLKIFDLNVINDSNVVAHSIMQKKGAKQLGIILNYNCELGKDVIRTVSLFTIY